MKRLVLLLLNLVLALMKILLLVLWVRLACIDTSHLLIILMMLII